MSRNRLLNRINRSLVTVIGTQVSKTAKSGQGTSKQHPFCSCYKLVTCGEQHSSYNKSVLCEHRLINVIKVLYGFKKGIIDHEQNPNPLAF
jgi:hypothetical protein